MLLADVAGEGVDGHHGEAHLQRPGVHDVADGGGQRDIVLLDSLWGGQRRGSPVPWGPGGMRGSAGAAPLAQRAAAARLRPHPTHRQPPRARAAAGKGLGRGERLGAAIPLLPLANEPRGPCRRCFHRQICGGRTAGEHQERRVGRGRGRGRSGVQDTRRAPGEAPATGSPPRTGARCPPAPAEPHLQPLLEHVLGEEVGEHPQHRRALRRRRVRDPGCAGHPAAHPTPPPRHPRARSPGLRAPTLL